MYFETYKRIISKYYINSSLDYQAISSPFPRSIVNDSYILNMSDIEEDFTKDLDLDLASEEEEERWGELEAVNGASAPLVDVVNSKLPTSDEPLDTFIANYRPVSLSMYQNLTPCDVCRLTSFEPQISQLLLQDSSDLSSVLFKLNDISLVLQREISALHSYMKLHYNQKFPELEDLVPKPLQYANVVHTLEHIDDCVNSSIAMALEQEAGLSKEQTLVLTMSMKTSFKYDKTLGKECSLFLSQSRSLMQELINIQDRINNFVMSKVSHVGPNVCALVGPKVTSLLLSHVGGILELSQIPSCNLASIGKNKHLSHELHTSITGVRQEGYIYGCPLIQEQPTQYHKQLLRMVCAKVSLAARVDAGSRDSSALDDSLGIKWKRELLDKIQKLQDTSAARNVKPLPVPMDATKKKRAGRKFRKYKQQFELSHLRQLQNRLEFGKQEQTMMNSFGEEIGLGMTSSALQNVTGSAGAGAGVTKRNVNNSAKLGKSMRKRINEANEKSRDYILTFEDRAQI